MYLTYEGPCEDKAKFVSTDSSFSVRTRPAGQKMPIQMNAVNQELKIKLTCVYTVDVILTIYIVAWGVNEKAIGEDFSRPSRGYDSQLQVSSQCLLSISQAPASPRAEQRWQSHGQAVIARSLCQHLVSICHFSDLHRQVFEAKRKPKWGQKKAKSLFVLLPTKLGKSMNKSKRAVLE